MDRIELNNHIDMKIFRLEGTTKKLKFFKDTSKIEITEDGSLTSNKIDYSILVASEIKMLISTNNELFEGDRGLVVCSLKP
ncbi:MAG: hypothetical protein Q8R57_05540, partial [Bacteroidota bacterium]|nr:hypothetical protein [Bacteroidota bacterium]